MTMVIEKDGTAVLTSWKEIAGYIGKGVRTVQRWEKEFGLPVRRPKQGSKSTVLAFPDEIGNWVRSQQFGESRIGLVEADRSALLRQIEDLQTEVVNLRRQLQMDLVRTA
jgi:hypothetical protein